VPPPSLFPFGASMSHALRQRLVALYAELAAMTEPECAAHCARPHTCCDEKYCGFAMSFARENWGVELAPTWHATLPLMGPDGCTAAPHLRPICTAHTCDISDFGCKRGDSPWTARYFEIQDAIAAIETELFPRVFV
jgi:hypothetical protein